MIEQVKLEQLRTIVKNLVRPGHMDMRQGRAFYELIDDYYALAAENKELKKSPFKRKKKNQKV